MLCSTFFLTLWYKKVIFLHLKYNKKLTEYEAVHFKDFVLERVYSFLISPRK